jgi:hypothetical protein
MELKRTYKLLGEILIHRNHLSNGSKNSAELRCVFGEFRYQPICLSRKLNISSNARKRPLALDR